MQAGWGCEGWGAASLPTRQPALPALRLQDHLLETATLATHLSMHSTSKSSDLLPRPQGGAGPSRSSALLERLSSLSPSTSFSPRSPQALAGASTASLTAGGTGDSGGSGYGNSGYGPSRADARDRYEPKADWNQDRDQFRDRDRDRDRAFDRADDRGDDRFGNRPGDWSQERGDQRPVDRPPARPSAPYPDRDLDPYAGEGGANPSYGPRRGGPLTARPRPPQNDPWAED